MEPVLSFENLTFRYPDPSGKGEVTALRNFSLAVGPGEAVAVVGESGSGKTTLSRLAAGILRGGEGASGLTAGNCRPLPAGTGKRCAVRCRWSSKAPPVPSARG